MGEWEYGGILLRPLGYGGQVGERRSEKGLLAVNLPPIPSAPPCSVASHSSLCYRAPWHLCACPEPHRRFWFGVFALNLREGRKTEGP